MKFQFQSKRKSTRFLVKIRKKNFISSYQNNGVCNGSAYLNESVSKSVHRCIYILQCMLGSRFSKQ